MTNNGFGQHIVYFLYALCNFVRIHLKKIDNRFLCVHFKLFIFSSSFLLL
jgi:hypothetical protein